MRQQFLYYQLLKHSGRGTCVGDVLDAAVDQLCASQLRELSDVPISIRVTSLLQTCKVIASDV